MPDHLKLAFVGCGAIARYHLEGLEEHAPRIQVTALVDIDRKRAESFAAKTGGTAFTSLDDALENGDFDAVDIMLPHDLHEQVAIRCFEAGKHVVLEKPMAVSLDACERIMAAARKAGTVFMVAENAQYWPEVVKASEVIHSGAIGDIITARAAFVYEFNPYWFQDDDAWRLDKSRTGGGVTIDAGSHWIRPLRMWMGEIDEAVAVAGATIEKMEGESLMRALLRFRSGKPAILDAMLLEKLYAPDPWWRVTGTRGEIVIESGFTGGLRLFNADHKEGQLVMKPAGYAESFGHELADFAAAVLDGKPLEAGPQESLGELRTALAIYRSIESKRWEKVWN